MAINLTVQNNISQYSLKNRAVVSHADPTFDRLKAGEPFYGKVVSSTHGVCYLTVEKVRDATIAKGKIGLSQLQRDWVEVFVGQTLTMEPLVIPRQDNLIGVITLEIDFFHKHKKAQPAVNTDELAPEFVRNFDQNAFCMGQLVTIDFKSQVFKARVIQMTAEDVKAFKSGERGLSPKKKNTGILYSNSRVVFERIKDSMVQLIGKHKGDSAHTTIISPDWDFKQMGIGGLDKEFSDIFRRAFASRVFPPDVVEQLGMKHVRGILLFGPPGTGKTLMARKIGQMLHAREPKIVNGPEILNKYVGESEANVRNLFGEAEAEQKKMANNSALHIIIFDEIDAICRSRGSLSGSTGVHDTVVNQLLSKLDGVEQLNNILVIGMTNRKDMIDEALLRPGRLEVQMEIGLPDENGRLEILRIHTAQMTKFNKLAHDVDLEDLAKRTRNFSGAEIEGLVRSAQSTAMNRLVQAKDKVSVTTEEAEALKVRKDDFEHALSVDIKPAFGISDNQLDSYVLNGILPWGPRVDEILDIGKAAVRQVSESQRTPLVSVLLRGNPGCGKTALAAYIAKQCEFPFVKVISPENMIGFSEGAKSQAVKKVFDDAYKSELSCIMIDDIERLLDYVAIGPRFSNLVLQSLLVLLRKLPPVQSKGTPHKLLIIGTTGLNDDVLELTGLQGAFNTCIDVPYLTSGSEVLGCLLDQCMYSFSESQAKDLTQRLAKKSCRIGMKKLLSIVEASKQGDSYDVDIIVRRLAMEGGLR